MQRAAGWIRARLLDRESLGALSRRSTARWLLVAAREWATIFALMWLCVAWLHPVFWVFAIVLIGSRQHALGVLVHDGAHFLVHRSRRWNDRLSNYLAAYPLYFPVQGYRTHHLEHHRLLETPEDPERITVDAYPREFTFPMRASRLYWLLLRDLIGGSIKPMSTLIGYVWAVPGGPAPHVRRIVIFHAAVVALAWATGNLIAYVVFWVIPTFTSFSLFFRLRTAAEHSGIGPAHERYMRESVDPILTTRTLVSGPITRYLFSPYNIAYHTEHHLYPSVPGFRLKDLRRRLLATSEYATRSHVTRGVGALIGELTTTRS